MTEGPVLETDRFLLRCVAGNDDLEPLKRWVADPALMAALNLPARALSDREARAYVAGFDGRTRFMLGVFPRRHRAGMIGFYLLEVNPFHLTATWHMAIGDSSIRAPDVTLEAGIAVLDWVFDSLGVEKMIGTCSPQNRVILQRYRSTGWREEGLLRGELRSMTGEGRLDQVRFGLLKAEWPAVRRRAGQILQRRRSASA